MSDKFQTRTVVNDKDVFRIQKHVQEDGDINISDSKGCTLLHWSCFFAWNDGVNFLLEHEADVNLKDSLGATPLMFACSKAKDTAERLEIVIELVSSGADVNVAVGSGTTALHRAAWRRHTDIVSWLCENTDIDLGKLTTKDNANYGKKGSSALDTARLHNHLEIVQCLEDAALKRRPSSPSSSEIQERESRMKTLLDAGITTWSKDDVVEWLTLLGILYEKHGERFRGASIDGPGLLILTDERMKNDLGVTSAVQRKHILDRVPGFQVDESFEKQHLYNFYEEPDNTLINVLTPRTTESYLQPAENFQSYTWESAGSPPNTHSNETKPLSNCVAFMVVFLLHNIGCAYSAFGLWFYVFSSSHLVARICTCVWILAEAAIIIVFTKNLFVILLTAPFSTGLFLHFAVDPRVSIKFVFKAIQIEPHVWYESYSLWIPTLISLTAAVYAISLYDHIQFSDRITIIISSAFSMFLLLYFFCYFTIRFILYTLIENATLKSEEFRSYFWKDVRPEDILGKLEPSEIRKLICDRAGLRGSHWLYESNTNPQMHTADSDSPSFITASIGIPEQKRTASTFDIKRDPTKRVAFSPKIRTVMNDPQDWASASSTSSFLPMKLSDQLKRDPSLEIAPNDSINV